MTCIPRGRLIVAAPELGSYLAQFLQPGLNLTLTGTDGQLLARADALAVAGTLRSESPLLGASVPALRRSTR